MICVYRESEGETRKNHVEIVKEHYCTDRCMQGKNHGPKYFGLNIKIVLSNRALNTPTTAHMIMQI